MDTKLRRSAEERLAQGTAPSTRGWAPGTNALTLLHGLASNPESAGDALKLLHELQVYQVELDLQQENAEQESRQIAEDLTLYTDLFELAPFAYLSLDAEGLVIAANRLAANWLAPGSGQGPTWAGRRVEDLLAPECRPAVRGMLAALRKGVGRQACAVQSEADGAAAHAVATATPDGTQVLMCFVPAGPGH